MQTYKKSEIFPDRTDFLKDVVSQLIVRRKFLGLSQEQLDTLIGNSDRLVSKWECGLRTPTSFNLFCWVSALECKIDISVKEKE